MADIFTTPAVQAVAGVLVVGVLIAGGFYLVAIFRGSTVDDRDERHDVMANFREMQREGDISDAEFRTIQSVMGGRPKTDAK